MLFDKEQFLLMRDVNTLQEAAARTGFTLSDMQALVDCELETEHVLDYICTVVSKQMN